MKLFPAIDILDKQSVRLLYGKRENVTVYGNPVDICAKFINEGAERLHLVDLNAAFGEYGVNIDIIRQIRKNCDLELEVGGGMRDMEKLKIVLDDIGIERAIIGTKAVEDPVFLKKAIERYGDRIVCGIDAKDGIVALRGWVESGTVTAEDLALKVKAMGVKDVVFTDISKDGALSGVNVCASAQLQKKSGLNVIASGGVKNAQDIQSLSKEGVYGAILGRALYTGDLTIQSAKEACRC